MPDWWSWPFVWLMSEWTIRIVMTPIVMRRKRPSAAMAWLAIIYFEPPVGLIFYALLGENRLPSRRIRARERALACVDSRDHAIRIDPHVMQPDIAPEQRPIVRLAERLTDMPIIGGNACELMHQTAGVVDHLIRDIDAAQHHVHLLIYIFRDDDTGRRVAAALAQAAERGVRCRVLADGAGSRQALRGLLRRLAAQGVEVEEALEVSLLRRGLARFDLRNHRKLVVIDGAAAYTGSQNIVNPDYGHRDLVWHDVTVRVTGPVVHQLQRVFEEDWFLETGRSLAGDELYPSLSPVGQTPIQTLPSGPIYQTQNYQRLLVTALHAATQHVIITTPYFIPDEPFLQAIQTAVMRGVEVEIIVPDRSNHPLVDAAGRAYRDDLLRMGVEIHLHRKGLLHAKTMTVDDAVALVGSGNFDMRSFYLNFELNLLLYGHDAVAKLRYLQTHYRSQSVPLDPAEWARRSRFGRTVDDAAKLFSPLL